MYIYTYIYIYIYIYIYVCIYNYVCIYIYRERERERDREREREKERLIAIAVVLIIATTKRNTATCVHPEAVLGDIREKFRRSPTEQDEARVSFTMVAFRSLLVVFLNDY